MKYQLVLQWPGSSIAEYDTAIAVEDLLLERMSVVHEVDGHDIGQSEVNIFIRTDDPRGAFEEVTNILSGQACWVHMRAAYREVARGDYTVIWPEGFSDFSVS
jgi:hypothetical protein